MMRRRAASFAIAVAALTLVVLGSAAGADDEHPVEELWPEEVPTPWFCTGTEPVDVCVPPW